MTPETIVAIKRELSDSYTGVQSAAEGAITLVRIPEVRFPKGCEPASTAALVVLDPAQSTPKLLLKVLPRLKNGVVPRSTGSEQVAGEGWYVFSFSQPWDENTHTGIQFVEGRLRRFALNE